MLLSSETLRDRLRRLAGSADPLADWRERRSWAIEIAEWAGRHPDDKLAMQILDALASDPKWEVRKALADSMLSLSDAAFGAVLKKLSSDENAFVANAVTRALDRRTPKPARPGRSRHKGLKEQLKEIQATFGSAAMRRAEEYGERLAREVLQSVAHDIKTTLTPFKPCIGEVFDKIGSDGYVRTRVGRIDRGLRDLESLVSDIDAFAQPIHLEVQLESITELVEQAAECARTNLLGKGRDCAAVKVVIDSDDAARIPVSRSHIHMALTNLIKNAIEAHAVDRIKFRDGQVTVTVKRDEQGVRIVITDTGGGLSARDLAKLQDFVPGHSSKSGTGGTGFGLPKAKQCIEAHRGVMQLANNDGAGLMITVILPDNS